MISTRTISELARKWGDSIPNKLVCPPEAKVITGDPYSDAQFHYFEQESGVALKVSDNFTSIMGYDVVDELKFTAFLLRWS